MTKPQITLKADEEILERFNKFKEQLKLNGLITYDKDALNLLMDTFEDSQLAKKLDFGPTFKELNQLVTRITEIFSNQAKQFETDKISREREQEESLNELHGKLNKAVEESNHYKKDLNLMEREVQDLKEITFKHDEEKVAMEKRIEQQAITSRSWETQYNKAKEELEQVKQENLEMKDRIDRVDELKAILSEMEHNKDELERKMKEEEKEHKNQIERIKIEQERLHMDEVKQARKEREQYEAKLNDKLADLQDKYENELERSKKWEIEFEKLKVKQQQERESQSNKKVKSKDEHPKPTTKTNKNESTLS